MVTPGREFSGLTGTLSTGTGSIEIPVLCLLVNGDPSTLEVGAWLRPPGWLKPCGGVWWILGTPGTGLEGMGGPPDTCSQMSPG